MRVLPSAVTARQAKRALLTHVLVKLQARRRDTGAMETLCLWTGGYDLEIVVGGTSYLHYGAGDIMGMDALTARAGLEVRDHNLTVSPLSAAVVTALRVYDPRLCPVEIYEWYWDPISERADADPLQVFSGTVLETPISQPEDGGTASAVITIASAAWSLTRSLPLKRSAAALQSRAPGDRFRDYIDLGRAVQCVWGEEASKPTKSPTPLPINPFASR